MPRLRYGATSGRVRHASAAAIASPVAAAVASDVLKTKFHDNNRRVLNLAKPNNIKERNNKMNIKTITCVAAVCGCISLATAADEVAEAEKGEVEDILNV